MNIVLVDDQHSDLRTEKTFLTNYLAENFAEVVASVKIKTFSNPEDFSRVFKPESFEFIILDIFMKPFNGIQIA